jgi:hypothetical protein
MRHIFKMPVLSLPIEGNDPIRPACQTAAKRLTPGRNHRVAEIFPPALVKPRAA